jgi:hypothetical protein
VPRPRNSDALSQFNQRDGLGTVERLIIDKLLLLGSGRPVHVNEIYALVEPALIGNMGIEDPAAPRQAESGRHAAFDQALARLAERPVESGAIAIVADCVTFVPRVPPDFEDFPGGPVYRPGTEHRASERQLSRTNWREHARQEQLKVVEMEELQRDLEDIRREKDAAYESYVSLVREHIVAGYLTDQKELDDCLAELTTMGRLTVRAARQRLGLTSRREPRKQRVDEQSRRSRRRDDQDAPTGTHTNGIDASGDVDSLDADMQRLIGLLARTEHGVARGQVGQRLSGISGARLQRLLDAFTEKYPGSVRQEPQVGPHAGKRAKLVLYAPGENGAPR